MTLKEKFELREKVYQEQHRFVRNIELGALVAIGVFFTIALPVSRAIAFPTKKCKVCYVDRVSHTIEVENTKKIADYYTVYYGSNDSVLKYIRYGDILNCTGPRDSKLFFFGTDVSKINGIKTKKYFEQQKSKTR
ncbi:MAG: hypothetical protein ACLRFK_03945 [Alphaproteobacteria bacterium]